MIYFDNAATTLPLKEVIDDYAQKSLNSYANPSSIHHLGVENNAEINRIRNNILKKINLDSNKYEVIFTSGATESNNLAILGYCLKNKKRVHHILTSQIEHSSVLEVFRYLETQGFKVDYIGVNSDGQIDYEELKKPIYSDVLFASFMTVNNEIGTVNDMEKLKNALPKGCVFHSDCAQTFLKEKVDYNLFNMFTISEHKIYGLKGIGALIMKKGTNIEPIIYGGGQEYNLRSGTLDYPGISSFNVAINMVSKNFDKYYKHALTLRMYLINKLKDNPEIIIHDYKNNNPYILNISLATKKASVVVEALSNKEIYVSSVSACNSKSEPISYVLLALGKSSNEAHNSIRISFGWYNTIEEIDIFFNTLNDILNNIRG
ncbi:MAG: cysteine desulfurase family protein [Bacilli bacterium]